MDGKPQQNGVDVVRERVDNLRRAFDDHVKEEHEDHAAIHTEQLRNGKTVAKLLALSRWAYGTALLVTGLLVYIFKTHGHP